jgi:3-deoxy-D-manno-octulosonic-acid transferase
MESLIDDVRTLLRTWFLNVVYLGLLVLVAPWLAYCALRHGKYRTGWPEKLLGRVPRRDGERFCVWWHAVSVGEVNLLGTLLTELARRRPDWECVVSTTTVTGYELAKKKYPHLTVCYCPLDFSWAAEAALDRLRPDMLVLAELELWPNLIAAAKRRQVQLAVVNGRLSPRSFAGYRRIRALLRPILKKLDLVAAQSPEYAERFLALGAGSEAVAVTGNVKFDGAQFDRQNPQTRRLRELAGIKPGDMVFLAGSTQAPEEAVALETYRELSAEFPQLRLIIVPRHAERFAEVAELLERSGVPFARRSRMEQSQTEQSSANARVLLVDSIGELRAWWGTADVAFVGGSLGKRGGQNMLEPAAYGAAISFGPNTQNFRDIVAALLSAEGAQMVTDGTALTQFVRKALTDRAWATQMGHNAQRLVEEGQGATARTIDRLIELVEGQAPVVQRTAARAA